MNFKTKSIVGGFSVNGGAGSGGGEIRGSNRSDELQRRARDTVVAPNTKLKEFEKMNYIPIFSCKEHITG